ncbi:rhodanese-like domain-containing protein [Methanotrichaceae archaeon M04Ac]|jgi:rhodanese-related sulfurtransferase|uniref:Rhodanese-like domain-containing protein n=1 Tax=Candidatus Methanocrinis alkalitolerans TaxID=3033395 RepID=A0ABT5XH30_9EURY|nr:rhodanese-like domain-containing protein [Candidatus Methanocrinis alkalitolerans]MCR3884405.1 rhodanese-like domain-containing protein [Methanothrix sp.]MDF0594031.1 rhodanese-like domain-containing protein [Candidatus Methanocrinis alkalitolerans]
MRNIALLVFVLLGLFVAAASVQAAEHKVMGEYDDMAESDEMMAEVDYMDKADEFLMSYPENNYYLMDVQELIDAVDAGDENLFVLDVRPAELYDAAHIPGSMNIPGPVLVTSMDMVPTDKKIAVVCTLDTNAAFAVTVLRIFADHDAWILVGGPSAWEDAGRELVPTEEM